MRDDFDLLNRLIEDMGSAPIFYRPTNYWQAYDPGIVKYLKDNGLKDFRSYSTSRLASLGAGTYRQRPLIDSYRHLVDYKGLGRSTIPATIFEIYSRVLARMGRRFDLFNAKKFFDNEKQYLGDFRGLQDLHYRHSKLLDNISGLNALDSIEDSLAGNPYDLFTINGRQYTLTFLSYFDQMAYMNMKGIKADKINSVMEIGSGYGGSAEVFVKAFKNVRYFNFDLACQVYICGQYLSTIFPGQVYTYKNYLANEKMDLERYRIFCLPTWTLESISGIVFDLFINSTSFQEMEPDIVKNYYSLISDRIDYAYLFQLTHGSYRKTSSESGGCIDPLNIEDIISIFKDFEVLARDEHYRVNRPHTDVILKRIRK